MQSLQPLSVRYGAPTWRCTVLTVICVVPPLVCAHAISTGYHGADTDCRTCRLVLMGWLMLFNTLHGSLGGDRQAGLLFGCVPGLPESMGHAACTGYEVGTMMLIYTMALAYGVASPIILPLALIYFIVQLCAPCGIGPLLQETCAWHCCCLLNRRSSFQQCAPHWLAQVVFVDSLTAPAVQFS